ncbi:ParB/RepB/Spo0J family partition protein [Aliiruegeria sabulilitoris]|uniref:ParB/RepB/Spo0J family partition protein n=1 Tax=Aliiruegeria sabulilitoris TaxID=1510458 RepID=UPI001E327CDD|nr:ParB N-terminal domain-containing protein [Aliiruegeria sabulilitoris]
MYREAKDRGLLVEMIDIDLVDTDDLPRDRMNLDAVAGSSEMEELKASIGDRGQKEPVEVYPHGDGRYQLKKGWRRLTALRQLRQERGDDRFGQVLARVSAADVGRLDLYVDMVEENIIREDITFAEMAQLAIAAAEDEKLDQCDAEELVPRLFTSFHKTKRSYVRSFVYLLQSLGDVLSDPKGISRDLGVEVARLMKANPGSVGDLRKALQQGGDEDAVRILSSFVSAGGKERKPGKGRTTPVRRGKYEFHVGESKVTARQGECRIRSDFDFSAIGQERLTKAIAAFEAALREDD